MINKINIALIGASGVVGRKIISLLEKRNLNIDNFYPLGFSSVGKKIVFKNQNLLIQDAADFDCTKAHLIILSAGSEVARKYANKFVSKGVYVVDLSSEFRYEENIPLIIPEINGSILNNIKKPSLILKIFPKIFLDFKGLF